MIWACGTYHRFLLVHSPRCIYDVAAVRLGLELSDLNNYSVNGSLSQYFKYAKFIY